MRVLICYYITYGNVYKMANLVADQALFTTQGGGSPYGPGHVAGDDNQREIDVQEAAICRTLGRRLAEVGLRLGKP
jgi:multimeric flavodoxin WrbA